MIAAGLHDEVCQSLVLARLKVKAVKQAADMEARRRAIEADIAGDGPAGGEGVEPFQVGALMDEAALFEDTQEVGLGHWSGFPVDERSDPAAAGGDVVTPVEAPGKSRITGAADDFTCRDSHFLPPVRGVAAPRAGFGTPSGR